MPCLAYLFQIEAISSTWCPELRQYRAGATDVFQKPILAEKEAINGSMVNQIPDDILSFELFC